MTLPAAYFEYPFRRPGMDHAATPIRTCSSVSLCNGPTVRASPYGSCPRSSSFPSTWRSKGVKPPGGLERPYPDYWNYTLRDYGNRVGFARVFRALEARGLKASVAMSSRLAERYPHVLQEVNRLGFELVAHGIDMNHIHATGVSLEAEQEWVEAFALDPAHAVGPAGQRVVFAGLFRKPRHARSGRRRGLRVRLRLGQ